MSDQENFLERWSRRKREAADEITPPQKAETPDPAKTAADEPRSAGKPAVPAPSAAFDLTKLPSLDSITAVTDMRAFLAPGVPQELARAALRRAWAADPAIRDFIGLAENSWDFTKPDGAPGFGDLPADLDIKKLVAQVFGDSPHISEAVESQPLRVERPEPPQDSDLRQEQALARPEDRAIAAESARAETERGHPDAHALEEPNSNATVEIVHRTNNIAMHNSIPDMTTAEPKKRRQHGGALPD